MGAGHTNVNKNTVYSYDSLGRLTQETYKEGGTSKWINNYTFDDYNNRETMVNTDVTNNNTKKTTYYSYDKANQLIREETTSNGATTEDLNYRYDDSGNLLAKESQTNGIVTELESHVYDDFNRVSSMTIDETTTSFTYDANNHRVSKTTGGVVTNQIWNGDNIICDDVVENNSSLFKTYIQGNDTEAMITNVENSTVYNFYANIYNGRGDVVKSMQLGGSTTESYQFDAYGNNTSDATYTIPNPFLYSGEYTDSETGKQYLRARYYDPTTGRFTQEDTYWGTEDRQFSLNLYTYCAQNPVMYSDPSGYAYWVDVDDKGHAILANPNDPSKLIYTCSCPRLTEELKMFIAVVCAEAGGENAESWKAVANVIMNRVKYPKDVWVKCKTVKDVITQKWQFTGYNDRNYQDAMRYLNNRNGKDKTRESIISTVTPVYNRSASDNTHGAQLYYSPKSMKPKESAPSWAKSKLYVEITVAGIEKNSFRFYKCK